MPLWYCGGTGGNAEHCHQITLWERNANGTNIDEVAGSVTLKEPRTPSPRRLTKICGGGKISLAVGARLTVGQRSLEPSVGVRIPGPQHKTPRFGAFSILDYAKFIRSYT